MNKTAIKNFAVEARRKLIASVIDKAGKIGITKDNITEASNRGDGFAVYPTHFGTQATLNTKEIKQRDNLVARIKEKGYDSVMEEVAYTWFNRIIAVRFMEVNDYLPSRVRVLSSETKGKFEPDIVTQAPNIDLEFTAAEKEEILKLKDKNEADKLFRLLFIKQCNALGEILPELFENTSKFENDYTEILFDISWNNEDGVIRDLLSIDEADFLEAVEIIGWMYQYYNTEPKDETFALLKKNVKITKERIPAATQLFTPDWIVRYMVENSLGRLWLESHSNEKLKSEWKYYLDEAEQEPDVKARLDTIRAECKNINPEDIKVIDPCMGSGHILVYAFEVLIQIYESCGYTARDAASHIIEKNIYGLDIDDRAYQLSYFAIMMKGRKYDRRFLTKNINPNLCSIQESNAVNREIIRFISQGDEEIKKDVTYILDIFKDSKEYGSILEVKEVNFKAIEEKISQIEETFYDNLFDNVYRDEVISKFKSLIKQTKAMAQKYDAVITNPPYMGGSGMGAKLSEYVKKNYVDSKSDLFAVFIEKCEQMVKKNCFTAMITQHAFMFLSSYEKLRAKMLLNDTVNMAHLGARAFEEIGGEVVQTTTWVTRKTNIKNYNASYVRLVDFNSQHTKEEAFIAGLDIHIATKEHFYKIPGSPIAYWVSERMIEIFSKSTLLSALAEPKQGIATADNNRFLRQWFEVDINYCNFNCVSLEESAECKKKWFPYNKGGEFRKWYGNNDFVVNWQSNGLELRNYKNAVLRNPNFYFRECISWSLISSTNIAFRYKPIGHLFDVAGMSCFSSLDKLKYLLGLNNTVIIKIVMSTLAPTINYQVGNIANIPVIFDEKRKDEIDLIVNNNIELSKVDWDNFETSWDFKKHPLI